MTTGIGHHGRIAQSAVAVLDQPVDATHLQLFRGWQAPLIVGIGQRAPTRTGGLHGAVLEIAGALDSVLAGHQ